MTKDLPTTHESIGDCLTVGEAAILLGISPSTLRNWDRSGKLKAIRHPINGYRLYKRTDIDAINKKVLGEPPQE